MRPSDAAWSRAHCNAGQEGAVAAGRCRSRRVWPRTVRKWVDRYRCEGLAGLRDRSSRPHRLGRPTPQTFVAEIERLRRQRWTGKQAILGRRLSKRGFWLRQT
ncbi:helix-turn-helix domain-containing protein [Sinorhizobium meliloti]|nr:helix-turn-helix domain-containing protein [Sinorhizobium meliloti]